MRESTARDPYTTEGEEEAHSYTLAMDEQKTYGGSHTYPQSRTDSETLVKMCKTIEVRCADLPCIHQLIERQVLLNPYAIALVFGKQTITYGELNDRANRIAHQLIASGVLPENCVGLCVVRSPAMIVGILAILKAGGAYVPIDPAYSSERSNRILEDVRPKIILSDEIGHATLDATLTDALTIIDPNILPDLPTCNPNVPQLASKNLAHVLYTSGTTGKPKGVMVEHRNIVRALNCCESWFDFDSCEIWCLLQSISFGYGSWTLWGCLYSGAQMVIATHEISQSPRQLQRLVRENNITVLSLTPNLLQVCIVHYGNEFDFGVLKYVIVAGDKLNPEILRPWFELRGENLPLLVNCYGATEMTFHPVCKTIERYDVGRELSPIGTRSSNPLIYLLDEHGQPVPNGHTGEIYIHDGGIARKYLNRQDLTREKFLMNPFVEAFDARMYRTGDLAYYSPDGTLTFMGRNDQQVKFRGFRIELFEIEAGLAVHSAVHQAVVVVVSHKSIDRLVAYVITDDIDDIQHDLHEFASTRFPEYMVPSVFIRVNEFPLTSNAKIDRSALRMLAETSPCLEAYEAPQGTIEMELAKIWRKLLGFEKIGRRDSFFALGGYSLLASRMIDSMQSLGWKLNVIDLYDHPVLSELAATVTPCQDFILSQNMITPNIAELTPSMLTLIDLTQLDIDKIVTKIPGGIANIQDIYSLAPLQNGILFRHLLAEHEDPYIITSCIEFMDRNLLNQYLDAFECVAVRHDILRSSFVWNGLSEPAQVVWRRAPLSTTEVTIALDDDFVNNDLAGLIDRQYFRMDLEQAPLVHFVISRASSERWVMFQIMHHLICDDRTVDMIHVEMCAFLRGHCDLPRPLPYRDFINEVRSRVNEEAYMDFFTEMLSDVDNPTLPFELREVQNVVSEITESELLLDSDLVARLRGRVKEIGVGLATLCHVSWAAVLSRACNQKRVVFGTVLLGRMRVGGGEDSAMGLYVNTLPLRLDVDDTPVAEYLRRTHTTLARLLEHDYAPLASVQRCSSIVGGAPLFSSLLNVRTHFLGDDSNRYPPGITFHRTASYTNYPLTMLIDDNVNRVILTTQVIKPICSERICSYMQQTFESIDDALVLIPRKAIQSLEVLPAIEREILIQTWNDAARLEPDDYPCVHCIFEKQVQLTSDAIALIHEEQTITYTELNIRANRLAHQLIELGVVPEERVAFCVDRTPEMMICILAILKAGGVYVPIDPTYACERVSDILNDATPKVILADQIGREAITKIDIPESTVLSPDAMNEFPDVNPRIPGHNSRCLAYIIYTSGSTGKPKGVMIEHRNIVRLFHTTENLFHFDASDVWCLNHSIAFDVSMWEVWGALRFGSRIVIVPHHVSRSAQELERLICQQHITILNLTPSAFGAFIGTFLESSTPNKLRIVILAGEKLETSVLNSWYAVHDNTQPQLINMYGTTETTIHATYVALTKRDADKTVSPIGERLPDTKLYLLDAHSQPVPIGAVGEIHLGGIGIGRGYLNRLELTNERFLADPFSSAFDARMYRTGDTAYYLTDGSLAYVSRNDQQVKIRGFRVELGEIEACISKHSAVDQVRVFLVNNDCVERLVAYVIAKSGGNLTISLHEHVAERLPEYMVPSAFVVLEEFPLTRNGKLDRSALPTLDQTVFAHQTYEAPQGSIEIELANIWSKLLGLTEVGRHDSFFTLGGHSLLAVQVSEHLRSVGWSLTVRDLFSYPVLSQLAATVKTYHDHTIPPNVITMDTRMLTPDMLPLIDLTQSDIDRIIRKVPGGVENIQDIYALSPLQDGMLFHHLLAPENDPYYFISQLAFTDRNLLDRYLAAIQCVIDRHDIFRTALLSKGLTRPAQVVWRHALISVLEIAEVAETHLQSEVSFFDSNAGQYRIDLERAPLVQYVTVRDASGCWILTEIVHHLIIDHTTVDLMRHEVREYMSGRQQCLPEPTPYRNLIAKIKLESDETSDEQFFKRMLQDICEPTIPYRITEVYSDGSKATESHEMLSSVIDDALRNLARRSNVSLASVFHLSFGLLISRISSKNNVVFGTVLYGRGTGNIGDSSAMGLFINTLPVRIDIDEVTVHQGLKRTHNLLAELLDHEHASLVTAQRCSSVKVDGPLFSALLNYRHNRFYRGIGDTIAGVEVMRVEERTNYPLVFSIEDYQTALGITVQAIPPINTKRLCDYMLQTVASFMVALGKPEEQTLRSIEVMPDTERADLLQVRNITERAYPDPPCVHHIFEKQAKWTPEAVAIVHAQQKLTYGELNIRANRLAHQLIELGVSPDERVALCVERSPAMIVGVLAILKTGAAYVPIDTAYSSQRSSHILNDAATKVILADDVGRIALSNVTLTELEVIDPNVPSEHSGLDPTLLGVHSGIVAYVIYTSGTTGKPKGVMVQHRNVVRLLAACEVHFKFDQRDTWCLLHSVAFDVSVWELWGALYHGGKLIIASRDISRSPEDLRKLVWEQGVTVMNFTPSAFREFANHYVIEPHREKLRYIIFAGEKLECAYLSSWYAMHADTSPQLVNMYGITEVTIHATYRLLTKQDTNEKSSLIGKRILHNKIYLLDAEGRPVPLGVVGEIYVGGAGVAVGYLNRPDLTDKRFLSDPFNDAFDARMYRSGDLALSLEDGGFAYLARNDQQVKIRGFRIEPGEIENCLEGHPAVRQALVQVISNQEFDDLVAYVIADPADNLNVELRKYASSQLAEYMVPSAFVRLDKFPLTQNGKIDRSALPMPNESAYASSAYEVPRGLLEIELAMIWGSLLKIDKIGRQDSFFALGGHSLLAVRTIEQLRARGWELSIKDLFNNPVLRILAQTIRERQKYEIPPNVIDSNTEVLTPDMLPLIELSQSDIDCIVEKVSGGIENIQDVYALSPLQEGILFHNLLTTGDDPYFVTNFIRFRDRSWLDNFLNAVQRMVDRHDILRTAFVWEKMSAPAQVVWRRAMLSVIEVTVAPDGESFYDQFRFDCFDRYSYKIDLEKAPLLRFVVARERSGSWLACQQMHHLICDEATIRSMCAELNAHMNDTESPNPIPYRNLIHTMRANKSENASIQFFSEMLRDVENPTLPFGLNEVHTNSDVITGTQHTLPQSLINPLRNEARRSNIGAATVCHIACGLVLSRICDQDCVVFGTVLLGRMYTEHGASTAMGLYINTLPIQIQIDETPVSISVRKTHGRLADLLEHEHASLALAQRCSNIPNSQPLFSTLFNFRQQQFRETSSYPSGIEVLETVGSTNYPLTISIDDDSSTMCLIVDAVRSVNARRLCTYMHKAIESVVDALKPEFSKSLRSLEILPCEEQTLIFNSWNEMQTQQCDYPCIHQVFEQQVRRTPSAVALVHEGETMSYAELNSRANHVAHELIDQGVIPETLVGLCVSRSTAMIVGVLAILKAGGTYVPVDPNYACERLSYILTDANPSIVLTDDAGQAVLNAFDLNTFRLLDPNPPFLRNESNPVVPRLVSTHSAYIIYTSGSTGKPKGVIVQHRSIVRLFSATDSWFNFNQNDVWCLFHSIAFDFSVWELWGSLSKGGKLIIVSQDTRRDLRKLMDDRNVTILNLTPGAFTAYAAACNETSPPTKLRYIIFGGEKLECSILRSWFATHGDASPQLVNMYGITETTVHATYKPLTRTDAETAISPIGKRIPDNETYLLDSHGRPVPLGAVGEIYIGGAGVTRGYLNRTDLTTERFLQNPFSGIFDARMYRTGDLAYFLENGDLAYVGRNDKQVNVRGFRVELQEVEASLMTHPDVRQALVRVISNAEMDRLVAYVVADTAKNLSIELHEYVSSQLPEYMVPSAFVMLYEFPLTQHGKIDCSALPSLDQTAFPSQGYEQPLTPIEIELSRIWSELLGVDRVGRNDSFFALGGNSLHAVRMTERMRSIGWTLHVRDLFDHPILFKLANNIVKYQESFVPPNVLTADVTELTPEMFPLIDLTQSDIDKIISTVPGGVSNIQDIYALSPLQDGLLFHNRLAPENDPYNLICRMSFTVRNLLDRYLAAIQLVIERHDILRTAFIWEGMTIPAQVVWRVAPILVEEITEVAQSFSSSTQMSPSLPDVQQFHVSLDKAPLLRYLVVRGTSGSWILTELSHHLIIDHSTLELIHEEVRAFLCAENTNLPQPLPFRNFIAEVRFGLSQNNHESFFKDLLADIAEPTMPYGVSQIYRDGSNVTESSEMLTSGMNKRLRAYARDLNVSLTAIFHLAYALLISVTSGRKNVVFGTVLLGRMKTELRLDSTLGLFINTLPIRVNVNETPVQQSLRDTHKLLARFFDHEHASLALAQRCSSIANGMPLFTALLNYRHNKSLSNQTSMIPGIEFLTAEERTNYPVIMSIEDYGTELGLTAQVVHPICSEHFRSHARQAIVGIADALEQLREISVQSIDILPYEERIELLETRNATMNEYADLSCIHHYFEQQTKQTPRATALVYEDERIPYAELNIQANRLAYQLIDLGVTNDERIALCVDRCPAMIIAMLAILKSGAAYVPLDPAYSSDRLLHILNDAAPRIAIMDDVGRSALGEAVLSDLTVLHPERSSETRDENPVISSDNCRNLSYIIYTSGSTGKPKGVMVEHRNVVRLFSATDRLFDFNQNDTWCLLTSIAFDFSVWELWGCFRSGARLVIVPRDIVQSPRELQELVCKHDVTTLNFTPGAFDAFIDIYVHNPVPDKLRYIILGGDKLETAVLRPWFAIRGDASPQLVNMYGITETTVHATHRLLKKSDTESIINPIGKRILDNRIYLLTENRLPVPTGVVGEIYIGGAGVTRGYLNRKDLTNERFLCDPFSDTFDARMYQTGDLALYLENGSLVYEGRNDQQIKIRGFRIEPSEIQCCIMTHPAVRHAIVLAINDNHSNKLVAYIESIPADNLGNELREYVLLRLPEYMVPAKFVLLDKLPLNQNGKIDRFALRALDQSSLATQAYEEPRGHVEVELAGIWCQMLEVDKVGRYDSFFALGGHSLLAVRLIEQLSSRGWKLRVRDLFNSPILFQLAATITQQEEPDVPPNMIKSDATIISPDMLPLIELKQSDIDSIVSKVPGGIENIQEIYALSPLQEGILFHNLLSKENDPYLSTSFIEFDDRIWLDRYLNAVDCMVDRHDILRTSFIWEAISVPAQVVWRRASLSITEVGVSLDDDSVYHRFKSHCFNRRRCRINLETAPLLSFAITRGNDGRWLACQFLHHLIGDETTRQTMLVELRAHLTGGNLPNVTPYRNFVHATRTGPSEQATSLFFTEMLGEIDSPTLPFGLNGIHMDYDRITVFQQLLDDDLITRFRAATRNLNVGIATLCHVAWALVLSRICDQRRVVFGTVLSGRMHIGKSCHTAMGLYINTLPLRVDVDDTPVAIAVRKVHTSLADLLEREHASLAIAQRCSSIPSGQALFSSLMNFRHDQTTEISRYPMGIYFCETFGNTNYPLNVSLDDDGTHLRLILDAMQPVNSQRLFAYMQKALESLVDTEKTMDSTSLCCLEVLPKKERELIVKVWNATEAHSSDFPCIHELFERQVVQMPDGIALVYKDETISYAELNSRANRLAHELIHYGVQPGKLVALCVRRTPAIIIGVLAVLKAGAAYVPIDPAYTCERLSYVLNDSTPSIILADEGGQKSLSDIHSYQSMIIDPNVESNFPVANPVISGLSAKDFAYLIYTSGSTGRPKGVIVGHRNIVRLFSATDSWFHVDENDVWCLYHSIAFDVSVWELWGSLSKGAKLVIVPQDVSRSPRDFQKLLWEQNVSVLNLTPSAFRLLEDNDNDKDNDSRPNRLRYMILTGEKLEHHTLKWWYSVHEDTLPQLVNMYGPTETTVYATYKPIKMKDTWSTESTIGKKLSDTKIYLLDSYLQPVPLRAVGELYIGGPGVACGYLNRCDLTNERFLPDPFSDAFDTKMYRTGDLAYQLEDGEIVYIGRNDHQIKVRGFRIEPSEIEACLTSHHKVRQALVHVSSDGVFDRLIAYVIAKASDDLKTDLRKYASAKLPEFMVPSAFMILDEFPLTQNGKIDRAALPSVSRAAFVSPAYEEPRSEVEIKLAEIWSEVLGIEEVGRNDSFFALGGHSLHTVRILERLRAFGWNLRMRDLFENPVLSDVAETVTRQQNFAVPPNVITHESTALTPEMLPLIDLTQIDIDQIIARVPGGISNIQDIYALSPLQHGLLFHNLLALHNDPYYLITRFAFAHRDLLQRYLEGFQVVVNRHDILRTAIIWKGLTVPAQVVWRVAPLPIQQTFEEFTTPRSQQDFSESLDPRRYPIDFEKAPLLRHIIMRESCGRWILNEVIHHLITDHGALELIHREIHAILCGDEISLAGPSPFRNYIAEVRRGASQETHENFFKDMLSKVDEATVPFGVLDIYRADSDILEWSAMLPSELNSRLRVCARSENVSLGTIFHVAYALVISAASSRKRVVYGTVLLGRMTANIRYESTMGLFINTLPFCMTVDETSVRKCLKETHSLLARLADHEHASLGLAQRCSNVASNMPLFTALLNHRHNVLSSNPAQPISGIEVLGVKERTNYPVVLSIEDSVRDSVSELGLTAHAVQTICVERLIGYVQRATEEIADAFERKQPISIQDIDILPNSERKHQLETSDGFEQRYIDVSCIHHIFERQVETSPKATALAYDHEEFTYAEVNARANGLANQLINFGVERGDRVAFCVDRTATMIIAILAILKTGAAYVPIDAAYSSERSSHILNDASPKIALVDHVGRAALNEVVLAGLRVLDPNNSVQMCEANEILPEVNSKDLIHVIYTSGSTGKPKGVLVQHRSVARLISDTDILFPFGEKQIGCLVNSISFDFSVLELWRCLCRGAQLFLVSRSISRSPQDLHKLICDRSITVLMMTPNAFGELARVCADNLLPDELRFIFISGERLDYSTLRSWYATHSETAPQLVNMYGITESTVVTTYKPITKRDVELTYSPIGTCLPEEKIYLLDVHRRHVPLGAIGEMYIAGAGVAVGYLNQLDLTEQRFLPDPFSDAFDARMYRTGDLAYYWRNDGLVYVGRNDKQVKIRGFRIEPGEVEGCLVRHPAVHQAHVRVVSSESVDRLVAYIVADKIDDLINVLRQYVESQLPEYMVPSAFVQLNGFPLTQNGKIDVRSLPAPEQQDFATKPFETPRGTIEIIVASTWGQLLGIDSVGRRDDFFTLGGHSILAVRMMSLLAYRGLICTLNDLFQYPVLADFALKISPDVCLPPRDAAVSVRSSGTESPLFCVPTGLGDFSYAFALSSYIRSSCPIYALPWPSFRDAGIQNMQELATYTINLMKTVQPQGPYRICGYSSGGILAYCVAEILSHAGETVGFVGLIDTCAPSILDDIPFLSENNVFVDDLSGKWGSNYTDKIEIVRNQIDGLDLIQCIKLAQQLRLYPANVCPDSVVKRLRQPLFYEQMMRQYKPEQLRIITHLFRAVVPSANDTCLSEPPDVLKDISFGWSSIIPDSLLRIIPLHGDHISIVEERENRLLLCQGLCAAIDSK